MSELDFFLDDIDKKPEVKRDSKKGINTFIDGEFVNRDDMRVFIHKTALDIDNSNNLRGSIPEIPNWLYSYSKVYTFAEVEEVIFLDTETTGLDRGASTFAFLTGVCYFRDNQWHLIQYFIEDVTHEPLLIKLLEELLTDFKILVSYNGKSYDIPLLDNRFKYHKCEYSIRTLECLDLMHLSRRFWKNSLKGCKLQDVEAMVLGFIRDYSHDIPGEMIPKTYFDYVASGDAEDIANVFYHNEIDLFSMTGILRICNNLKVDEQSYYHTYKIDTYAIAKLLFELQYDTEGFKALQLAYKDNPKREETVMLMVNYLKKYKDYEEAVEVLENIQLFSIIGNIELSKLYEHKIKDLNQALERAKHAYLLLHEQSQFDMKTIREVEKRITRLKGKLSK
jgi:uncharacterized protein YprB with RNaseH-like and TPR domain